jgi:hypothetical protein
MEDRIRGYSLTKLDTVFAIMANYRNAVIRMLTAADESTAAQWEGVARRLHERWRDWHGDNSLHELAFSEPGPLHIEEFSKAVVNQRAASEDRGDAGNAIANGTARTVVSMSST